MKNGADLLAFGAETVEEVVDLFDQWEMGNEPTAATTLLSNMADREIKIAGKKK